MLRHLFRLVILLTSLASANVEKQVFLGPPASSAIIDLPSLSILTPPITTIRTQFHSRFEHTAPHPLGISSNGWLILTNLKPRKRYEVRICWPATQPTSFDMQLYTSEQVTQNQELMKSLQAGSSMPRAASTFETRDGASPGSSRLFLHVEATADYFTMNQTLMENGLIVDVDIILDEYIWNLAPSSLLYTGLYLVVVTVVAVFVSRLVLQYITGIVTQNLEAGKAVEKKTT